MQHVGKRIKTMIDESKYSAKEIAEKMGTSFQNVYRLFEKESVETKHLFKIAEALGIQISQFFEEESRNDLTEEIKKLKGEIQSNIETITQLQNQIKIFEKLVKSNETLIRQNKLLLKQVSSLEERLSILESNFESTRCNNAPDCENRKTIIE